jgi:predicted TIM-barrel fold metal-dependent hydrolase
MIIDAHTHGLHGRYLDQLAAIGGEWVKKDLASETERAKARPIYMDVTARLKELDRFGIDGQMVTLGHFFDVNQYPGALDEQIIMARTLNDNMARFQDEGKGRLFCAATVPLKALDEGGAQEMDRAIHELRLKAFNITSHVSGKPLDLPEFEPFWSKAAAMNIPVIIHPTNPITTTSRAYEGEYDLIHVFGWPFETTLTVSRLVFSGILDRYPDLKIITHHLGGGMIPFFWGRVKESYIAEKQRKYFGQVMSKELFAYFSLFYYDTAVGGSAPAIKMCYDLFGAEQIVFATDAPHGPEKGIMRLATYPAVIRSLGLPEADTRKILGENAAKIFDLA